MESGLGRGSGRGQKRKEKGQEGRREMGDGERPGDGGQRNST